MDNRDTHPLHPITRAPRINLILPTLHGLLENRMPPRVPAPSHRHAMPSGPWPWMDLDSEVDPEQLEKEHKPQEECPHIDCKRCWEGYPQSLFGNWTPAQVKRSGIADAINPPKPSDVHKHCTVYEADMSGGGRITKSCERKVTDENKDEFWNDLLNTPVPENVQARCYFLDNLSGPVLQILGTKFNIEPFFFSSSLSWIPCRYQENLHAGESDHITVTLTFLRTMQNPMTRPGSVASGQPSTQLSKRPETPAHVDNVIDTQSPLPLRSTDKILLLDLLALHMVRTKTHSTIISFHPTREWRATSAKRLWTRVRFAGQSVYWQKIFEKTDDATFLLLAIIWHALYAWDEALETLYSHICWLESRVISTNDILLTQELHIIRAHLLHWESLIEDMKKAVDFVHKTPNPIMDSHTKQERHESEVLMDKEVNNLLSEITRIEKARRMQDMRLKNVMNLVFSTVNMEDSKQMKKLTQATVRDSAAMKQISYLTMVFLPATFVAGIFGMNVQEINPGTYGTLPHYVSTAIPFTIATIYFIVAMQSKHYKGHENASIWLRLAWPWTFFKREFLRRGDGKKPVSATGFGDEDGEGSEESGDAVTQKQEDHWPQSFP